jgi:orotate phosphoribosyltransferase-like protein
MDENNLAVLNNRVQTIERELMDLKKDGFIMKEQVNTLNLSRSTTDLILKNISDKFDEMKVELNKRFDRTDKSIDDIASRAGKDSKWRDVLKDIISVVILIVTAVVGFKYWG